MGAFEPISVAATSGTSGGPSSARMIATLDAAAQDGWSTYCSVWQRLFAAVGGFASLM